VCRRATGQLLAGEGLARGKYTVRVEASDAKGRAAEVARAEAWVNPCFRNGGRVTLSGDGGSISGNGGADLKPPDAGVTRRRHARWDSRGDRARHLEQLGVGALWLSPVYLNPTEPRLGRDGHMSSRITGTGLWILGRSMLGSGGKTDCGRL